MGGRSDGGGFGGGVAVGGGKVFVSSGYRTVTAIDQASGAVIWTTPVRCADPRRPDRFGRPRLRRRR